MREGDVGRVRRAALENLHMPLLESYLRNRFDAERRASIQVPMQTCWRPSSAPAKSDLNQFALRIVGVLWLARFLPEDGRAAGSKCEIRQYFNPSSLVPVSTRGAVADTFCHTESGSHQYEKS